MKPTRFLTVALVLLGMIGTASALTPAGATITNQATGNYQDANGNSLDQVLSNEVTTTVTQVAGVSLDNATQAGEMPSLATRWYTVTLTNAGNGDDFYTLGLSPGTGQTGSYTYELYHDVNENGTYDSGTDLLVGSAPDDTTGSLAYDQTYELLVKVVDGTTNGAPQGDVFVLTLTATSDFTGTTTATATLTTTVQRAALNVVVTGDVANPIPGSTIIYSVCITNAGDDLAYNTIFTNAIPTNTTYVPGSIRYGGSSWATGATVTDVVDSPTPDIGDYNVTTTGAITVDLGDIAVAGAICVHFKVTIDAGTDQDVVISNDPVVVFENANTGGDTYPTPTPTGDVDITISESFGVDIAATGTTVFTGDPGDALQYDFTVQNLGNGTDFFNLSTNTTYVTWLIYADNGTGGGTANDGILHADELAAGAITVTGSLTELQMAYFIAIGTITAGTADAAVASLSFTATSDGSASVTDSVTGSATCTAPIIVSGSGGLFKAVSPEGDQPPGTTLTYTLTVLNSGTGDATNVVITDDIPTNTTYVDGSLTLGMSSDTVPVPISVTDADDLQVDGGDCDGTTVTFTLPTFASGASETMSFQVTIN